MLLPQTMHPKVPPTQSANTTLQAIMATVPKEIRDHILKDVYDICRLENRPTIAYASVCPKWQGFFEAKHFAKLNVTLPRLADFDRIVVGERRELVRHIR